MKKTLTTVLSSICTFICLVMMGACVQTNKMAGTYKMKSVTGTITANGVTQTLSTDLYEYYNITLNNDGTALVEAKGANSAGMSMEGEATWESEGNVIKLKTQNAGVTVVEEMQWHL